jgi:thioredoxin reductase
MASVVIIGDGPGGLSAALFLAKNGQEVTVYGQDHTALHYAYLYNYLGAPDTSGTDFQDTARRQAVDAGARLVDEKATAIKQDAGGFEITGETGTIEADYVILSEGKSPVLAVSLGLEIEDGRVVADADGRSSLARVYVVGRSARPRRSQAIISAGAGAAAAIDILSIEADDDVQDWDTPPKDD